MVVTDPPLPPTYLPVSRHSRLCRPFPSSPPGSTCLRSTYTAYASLLSLPHNVNPCASLPSPAALCLPISTTTYAYKRQILQHSGDNVAGSMTLTTHFNRDIATPRFSIARQNAADDDDTRLSPNTALLAQRVVHVAVSSCVLTRMFADVTTRRTCVNTPVLRTCHTGNCEPAADVVPDYLQP